MPKEPPKERMLDFAPSNRGSCKNCGSKIPEGSCRVTKYVNSPWHDGFSAERYLPACLDPGHGADSLDKIKNLGAVRFKDQVQLLTQIGVKISKNAAKNKTASDAVFALADRMTASAKPKDLKTFMEANGMQLETASGDKKDKYLLAYEVADCLLHGKPGTCPICDGKGTLRTCYPATEFEPTVQCHGLLGGGARCEFGKSEVRKYGGPVIRERVIIPDELFTRKTFFKDYVLPKAVQALPGAPPAAAGGAPAAQKAAKGEKKAAKKRKGAKEAPVKRKKLQGHEESLKVHPEAPQGKVYVGEGGTCAYNVTLSQADLATGVNKFYILQLLETNQGYVFWTKWGRVGESKAKASKGRAGQEGEMHHDHDSVGPAIKEFEKKFKDKTKNEWKNRASFVQKGAYNMVLMDGNDNTEDPAQLKRASKRAEEPPKKKKKKKSKNDAAKEAAKSNLEPRVLDFVRRIFDDDMMTESLKRQNIDIKKMPLGSLSRAQVSKGYEILCAIQENLQPAAAAEGPPPVEAAAAADEEEEEDSIAKERRAAKIKALSQQFYNTIPHVFPEGAPPSYIDNAAELRLKTDLIQSLEQLQDAAEMKASADASEPKHDEHYKSMNCPLRPVDRTSDEWRLIADYVKHGQGGKRSVMGNSLGADQTVELVDVLAAARPEETEGFTAEPRLLKHRQLLWHGSGMGNWGSILKTGLRIAPPEAPVTGWLFGKGMYFANVIGKSAAYCQMTGDGDYGVLALLEGDHHMCRKSTTASTRAAKAVEKKGVGHTWAVGCTFPTPPHATLPDGCVVPSGPLTRNINRLGSTKSEKLKGPGTLEYDEYIVYAKTQAKIRYVVTVKFGTKGQSYDLT